MGFKSFDAKIRDILLETIEFDDYTFGQMLLRVKTERYETDSEDRLVRLRESDERVDNMFNDFAEIAFVADKSFSIQPRNAIE